MSISPTQGISLLLLHAGGRCCLKACQLTSPQFSHTFLMHLSINPQTGYVDHSTIYDPTLDEDYPSPESNKIPPLGTKEGSQSPNGPVPPPSHYPKSEELPNEILLSTLGQDSAKNEVGIAYAEGGMTGKPSPDVTRGRGRTA